MRFKLGESGLTIFICCFLLALGCIGCTSNNAHDTSNSSVKVSAQPDVVSIPSMPTASPSVGQSEPVSFNAEAAPVLKREPQQEGINREEKSTELAVECGKLSFDQGKQTDQVQLPLICIRATYGADDPNNPPAITPKQPLKAVSYSIPAELQNKLAAYWMNLGDNVNGLLLLAPIGWKVDSGAVGANGSSAVRLENPEDPGQYISYMDSGGCQGCIIANIGTYFPELRDWAEQQGFTPDAEADIQSRALLSPNLMAYSKKPTVKGYELNGVAYQEHGGSSGIFRMLEVQLPKANHGLAKAILNFLVANHLES